MARQSVPRPSVHTLINIRVSDARTAKASPIVAPLALWVSIKINIRTRVSSHRKYAAHPSCNRRHCFYIGSHISVSDQPACNIAHWWSLRNYSNQFFDVDLVDFSCVNSRVIFAVLFSSYVSCGIYPHINASWQLHHFIVIVFIVWWKYIVKINLRHWLPT